MESIYHIVTIRVNETSWAHVWRLPSLYLGTGYDTDLFELPKVIRVRPRLSKGYSGLIMSQVRLGSGWVRKVRYRVRKMGLAGLLQCYPSWVRVT
jgi:hypothetical protein